MRKFLITAMESGQGKTVTTMALLAALSSLGYSVQSYKVGPDYIDPSLHERILQKKSYNLDGFFLKEKEIQELYQRTARSQISIIEGVMGYYDGLGGRSTQASSWNIGEILGATGILVLRPRGSSLSLVAQIRGILDFRPNSLKGLILSCCTQSHYLFLKELLQEETGLKVLGYLPEEGFLGSLDELHGASQEDFSQQMEKLAELCKKHLDLEGLLALSSENSVHAHMEEEERQKEKLRLAYAKDEAFAFLYHENLHLLEKAGFELVPFSPLRDAFPENCHGLYLCGGYQQDYLEELSRNQGLLRELKQRVEAGLPTLAEAGGFVYLHEGVQDKEGRIHPLVGIFPGVCTQKEKLQQFGYVELRARNRGLFLREGEVLRGHFYHRWACPDAGRDLLELRPLSGKTQEVFHQRDHLFAGLGYLYLPSAPATAEHFYDICRQGGRTWVDG